jgi:rhodanese-related sulfurtransferase
VQINLKKILLVVLSSTLMGLAYNYLSPGGVGLFAYNHKKLLAAEMLGTDATEPKQIHVKEAFDLYNADVVFLDAREPEDFKSGHIKNAVNIFADDFETYRGRLKNILPDEPVVTYCGGTDCDLSIVLATKLSRLGYKKIFIFFGGWNEWTEAGYPTEKSGK